MCARSEEWGAIGWMREGEPAGTGASVYGTWTRCPIPSCSACAQVSALFQLPLDFECGCAEPTDRPALHLAVHRELVSTGCVNAPLHPPPPRPSCLCQCLHRLRLHHRQGTHRVLQGKSRRICHDCNESEPRTDRSMAPTTHDPGVPCSRLMPALPLLLHVMCVHPCLITAAAQECGCRRAPGL
jgi:hypothetical protein